MCFISSPLPEKSQGKKLESNNPRVVRVGKSCFKRCLKALLKSKQKRIAFEFAFA